MGASVRMEDFAFSDERFDLLASMAGLADADHARGKVMRLWRACTLRQSYVLPENIVSVVVDPAALVAADLAERAPDGIRIKGTEGRIEWWGDLQRGRSAGGRARASMAARDERGRMVSQQRPAGDLESWHQHSSSTPSSSPPALSSAPVPSPAPAPVPVQDPPISPLPERGAAPLAAGPAAPQPNASRSRKKKTKPSDPTPEEWAVVERVLEKLSERSGATFGARNGSGKPTEHAQLVLARMRDGASERDLRVVVWHKASKWEGDPEWQEYLRPSTLFGPRKFAEYLPHARRAREEYERERERGAEPARPPVGAVLAMVRGGSE